MGDRILRRIGYYFNLWLLMSRNSFLGYLWQKKIFAVFLSGKIIRFIFFTAFLYFIIQGADSLAGYNSNQALFIFLTFSLIDTSSQFLFRNVYRFRPLVVSGDFDLVLAKPMSALFRVLFGGADVIDLVTIPPLIIAAYYVGSLLAPTTSQVFIYLILLANGLLISTAFHVLVLSLGIITFEIDHSIMIFRDLTQLGRLPIEIYREPLKGALTYLIPVAIMIAYPAKAFMGLLTPIGIIGSFGFGFLAMIISLKIWRTALKKYSSASS